MRIISFAWTSPALLAGRKTITRRDWDDDYGKRFQIGEEVLAYNRSPWKRGEPIARLRIVSVGKERDCDAPESDYEAEGFAWFVAHPECLPKQDRDYWLLNVSRERFERWRNSPGESWVIRFEVLELLP